MQSSGGPSRMTIPLSSPTPLLLVLFSFLLFFPPAASCPSPLDPLVEARVIPDVIDVFKPAAEVSAHYGRRKVVNGCYIKPSAAAARPAVRINGLGSFSDNLYTLIMSDPDAPSRINPWEREWLHWIVVDIPAGCDATKGKELVRYMGPRPPMGIHRYVFTIFRQNGTLEQVQPPQARANFKTRKFAAQNGLRLPAAAIYFNAAAKEPTSQRY